MVVMTDTPRIVQDRGSALGILMTRWLYNAYITRALIDSEAMEKTIRGGIISNQFTHCKMDDLIQSNIVLSCSGQLIRWSASRSTERLNGDIRWTEPTA